MPERSAQSVIMGYACAFTLAPTAPLVFPDDPESAVLAVLAAMPLVVRVVCSPVVGAVAAAAETPRLARATPLAIVEVVTQFEDEGVVKAPAGVVKSPMV